MQISLYKGKAPSQYHGPHLSNISMKSTVIMIFPPLCLKILDKQVILQIHNILQYVPSTDRNTWYFTYILLIIPLALALKTRLCVYMYLPYACMYVQIHKCTHSNFYEKFKSLKLWGLPTTISERESNNSMSPISQLGQNKHNYVWKAYWLCLYKYIYTDSYINTYTKNMEYTYTHTLALNSVSHYYLYHFFGSSLLIWFRQLVTIF